MPYPRKEEAARGAVRAKREEENAGDACGQQEQCHNLHGASATASRDERDDQCEGGEERKERDRPSDVNLGDALRIAPRKEIGPARGEESDLGHGPAIRHVRGLGQLRLGDLGIDEGDHAEHGNGGQRDSGSSHGAPREEEIGVFVDKSHHAPCGRKQRGEEEELRVGPT